MPKRFTSVYRILGSSKIESKPDLFIGFTGRHLESLAEIVEEVFTSVDKISWFSFQITAVFASSGGCMVQM